METGIPYGNLMQKALRGLVREVLADVAERGLPGAHHFIFTFDPRVSGTDVPEWLVEDFPEEIRIVMQNWFEDLVVSDEGFAVTLNFNNTPERLTIPFEGILSFVDPSAEFGLRFDLHDDGPDAPDPEPEPDHPEPDTPERSDEAVVQLDRFRKS